MMFNVPQFIDIEDKIVGPLTGKQFLWMLGMSTVLFLLWMFLEFVAFIIVAIPVVIIFSALAFYRPYNQPLIKFVFSGTYFFFRPKTYTWHRSGRKKVKKGMKKGMKKNIPQQNKKTIEMKDLKSLANILDNK